MFKIFILMLVIVSAGLSHELLYSEIESRDGWNIDILDSGIEPTNASICIDSQGYPHVAYIRTDGKTRAISVEYAFFNGYCWEYSTVASGSDFRYCYLGMYNDVPNIAFQTGGKPFKLSLAVPGMNNWIIDEFLFNTESGHLYDLKMGNTGNPHMMYYRVTIGIAEKDLHHIYFNGSSWIDQSIWWFGDGAYCCGVSLALSAADVPHFSQYNGWTGWSNDDDPYIRLYHTTYIGGSWEDTNLGDSDGDDTDIVLDSNDRPRIVFQTVTQLRMFTYNGSTWENTLIDPSHQAQNYCALAIDGSDINHVAYHESSDDDLRYAWGSGSSWNTMLIDSFGTVGTEPDIALDGSGNPFIVYNDETMHQLKLAWYGDPTGINGQESGSDDDLAILDISPNPIVDMLNLRVASTSDAQIDISVYDLSGRMVQQSFSISCSEGISELPTDVSNLESGIYLVRISNGSLMDAAQITVIH